MAIVLCQSCGQRPIKIGYYCEQCESLRHVTSEDIRDRIVVLNGVERTLRGKLLSIRQPSLMLDHAESLERQAAILLDKAQVIRNELMRDTANESGILKQLDDCTFERNVLEACLRLGIKPKRIRKMLDRLKREMEGGE